MVVVVVRGEAGEAGDGGFGVGGEEEGLHCCVV